MSEKSPRKLHKERKRRIFDTIAIKEPDRVPISPMTTYWPMMYKGMTKKEAMYDLARSSQAIIDTVMEFQWDTAPSVIVMYPVKAFDIVDSKLWKWPGAKNPEQRVDDNAPYQFCEGEYMKANEYEEFFEDPTNFVIRKVIPRHYGALSGFKNFPSRNDMINGYMAMMGVPFTFLNPEFKASSEKLGEALKEVQLWFQMGIESMTKLQRLGFPPIFAGIAQAPFDVVSEFLRGMRGSMLDMYRHPEELLKLIDTLTKPMIKGSLKLAMLPDAPIIFIPLHRGADGFMSDEQFRKFYWPSLKELMVELIKAGKIPMPFFEGKYNSRLEYIQELGNEHPGKIVAWFDQTDIFKAKEMFGDKVCIRGNIPGSLMVTGTPNQVEEYCKKCIEIVGEGGGYILDGGVSGIPDESKPENVKAMTDSVFKYGLYKK
ncbi:MAG: uroporphyrinogen decarboxylase family protein [Candidatus Helarchaeota archaeon]